ncbi:MAG: hypothetical protein KF772_00540 [Cryobacterium sp.]|nr:hypothetical protein [Cryobacterium sp.]
MTRFERVVRGGIAALVSVFVAAFSHAVAGGQFPGIGGLLLSLALSTLVCIALAGRKLRLASLSASVLLSQGMYHWLFGGMPDSAISTSVAPQLGHSHLAGSSLPVGAAHAHTSTEMLIAHVLAAVVTVLALAFGERAMLAIARVAGRFLIPHLARAIDPELPAAPAHPAVSRTQTVRTRLELLDHSGLRHRGPPILLGV